MKTKVLCVIGFCAIVLTAGTSLPADEPSSEKLVADAQAAMKRAATFYHSKVASHGGYVYHYSLDLDQRWGEGVATKDQIWVQPPGTPTVGLAYLDAYRATGDRFYLEAATDAANALVYGQLKSGGWQNCVDFDPRGNRRNLYRNGRGGGKNNSSFDDGQTQSALLLLIRVDEALQFKDEKIHESTLFALDAVLNAQFESGGFPQVFTGPVKKHPVEEASYPDYDWKTEGRIKEYWDHPTINDNVPGYLMTTLLAAHDVYKDAKYLNSAQQLGDFLIHAQMPEPQPGWAQQYNHKMQPIWARRFEPPAVSGDETQEVIETLLTLFDATGDKRFLEPIPSALDYLDRSELPDGQLARYYELRTNRPLYMTRSGRNYSLTFDDSDLPAHYGWKVSFKAKKLRKAYISASQGEQPAVRGVASEKRVQEVINSLDDQGRWIDIATEKRLVGQPKIAKGEKYLSSHTFSQRMSELSAFVLFNTKPE